MVGRVVALGGGTLSELFVGASATAVPCRAKVRFIGTTRVVAHDQRLTALVDVRRGVTNADEH